MAGPPAAGPKLVTKMSSQPSLSMSPTTEPWPRCTAATPARSRGLPEGAVAPVQVEPVGSLAAGHHEQILPAVAVEVPHRDAAREGVVGAARRRVRVDEPGRLRAQARIRGAGGQPHLRSRRHARDGQPHQDDCQARPHEPYRCHHAGSSA